MRGWDVVEIQLLFTWVLAARVKQKLNFWFGGGGRMGFLGAGMGCGRNSTSLHVGAGCTCKAEIELLVWWWGGMGFLDAGMGRGRNSTSLHVGAGCTCKAEIELLGVLVSGGECEFEFAYGVGGCWATEP